MTWRRARAVAAVALGTGVLSSMLSACLSPTLPLPPPGPPGTIELSADLKTVQLTGTANPRAFVMFFNNYETVQKGAIVLANDQGEYAGVIVPIDLSQNVCNPFQIWQRIGSDDSAAGDFDVGLNCNHRSLPPPDAGLSDGPSGGDGVSDGGVE
ncbi:MAG TPA: hypothetical protein VF881_15930 [Polyangiaceae bacterium]